MLTLLLTFLPLSEPAPVRVPDTAFEVWSVDHCRGGACQGPARSLVKGVRERKPVRSFLRRLGRH